VAKVAAGHAFLTIGTLAALAHAAGAADRHDDLGLPFGLAASLALGRSFTCPSTNGPLEERP